MMRKILDILRPSISRRSTLTGTALLSGLVLLVFTTVGAHWIYSSIMVLCLIIHAVGLLRHLLLWGLASTYADNATAATAESLKQNAAQSEGHKEFMDSVLGEGMGASLTKDFLIQIPKYAMWAYVAYVLHWAFLGYALIQIFSDLQIEKVMKKYKSLYEKMS